jgi:NAD(P)-dependent dehydrogenase (short-subunit alcohol dehydrogenase family)
MDLKLEGKSVIVTGGVSNIGRAITLALTAEGANVTIADLDGEQAEVVLSEVRANGAGKAQFVRTDVTKLEEVEALASSALDKFAGIDVLVNNVGWDQLMFFTQTTPEFWQKIISINHMGVLNCTRAALEPMIKQGHGAIVSISSDASRQGEPREAVYGGMKAAVNSFMKTIAKENGRYGIRCNVVCPGVTVPEQDHEVGESSMWANKDAMFTPEQFEKIAASLPLKKVGRPGDIANAVTFLVSDAVAGHITGQVLSVSGGYSMVG